MFLTFSIFEATQYVFKLRIDRDLLAVQIVFDSVEVQNVLARIVRRKCIAVCQRKLGSKFEERSTVLARRLMKSSVWSTSGWWENVSRIESSEGLPVVLKQLERYTIFVGQ